MERQKEDSRAKVMSLRLPEMLAAELTLVARVDGIAMAEAIRQAIEQYIAARRGDPEFQERLKEQVEAERKVIERLAD